VERPGRRKLLVASIGVATVSYALLTSCDRPPISGNLPSPPPQPPVVGNLPAPPPPDGGPEPAPGGDAGADASKPPLQKAE
jgi:hypothetical protein